MTIRLVFSGQDHAAQAGRHSGGVEEVERKKRQLNVEKIWQARMFFSAA